MLRALYIVIEGGGNYLRHVRAMSSLRTAGSLDSENRDSVQRNKSFKSATSYCILTFGQLINMNSGCAYTKHPSVRIEHFTHHSDIGTKRLSCVAASHFLLKLLSLFLSPLHVHLYLSQGSTVEPTSCD